jgi:hypothetical protein
MVPGSDLCKECAAVAAQMTGGLLLQAPRGHATFNDGLFHLHNKSFVF